MISIRACKMWLHTIVLAAALSAACGMCFGDPVLQQQVACPEPSVYYSQLCICLEPRHKDRLHETGSLRKVPNNYRYRYLQSPRKYKNQLNALRYRLSASLPDMGRHTFSSSIGDIREPLIIFPDHFMMPSAPFTPMVNHLPRSWRIGGLLEAWSKNAFENGRIPTINTAALGGIATSSDSTVMPWATGSVDDMSALSLMERLQILRGLWREATHGEAQRKLGDNTLPREFFKHLPTTGISPDASQSIFQYAAGVPEIPQATFEEIVRANEQRNAKMPLFSRKEAVLKKQGLGHILPKGTARRTNSYLRSMMRLKSAKGT